MKIVSSTKDYYDYLAGMSQDNETVFRRPREFLSNSKGENIRNSYGPSYTFRSLNKGAHLTTTFYSENLNPFWVYFCGKEYFGLIDMDHIGNTLKQSNIRRIYWQEAADEWLKNNNSGRPATRREWVPDIPIQFAMLYERTNHSPNVFLFFARFMWPTLKDIFFGRVVRPEDAYNEIYKYLCTNGRPEPVIPQMTNDIKIEQHGFNLKQSFRNMKRTND